MPWMRLVRRSAFVIATLVAAVGSAAGQEAPTPVGHVKGGFLPEPHLIATGVDYAGKFLKDAGESSRSEGWYPTFQGPMTGAGWISLGAGYRLPLLESARARVDVSASVSWRGYKSLQATFEVPNIAGSRCTVGSQALWEDLTQLQYFGASRNSLEENRSEYRLTTLDVIGYTKHFVHVIVAGQDHVDLVLHGVPQPVDREPPKGTMLRGCSPTRFHAPAASST